MSFRHPSDIPHISLRCFLVFFELSFSFHTKPFTHSLCLALTFRAKEICPMSISKI